jgi:hypothetical protein
LLKSLCENHGDKERHLKLTGYICVSRSELVWKFRQKMGPYVESGKIKGGYLDVGFKVDSEGSSVQRST